MSKFTELDKVLAKGLLALGATHSTDKGLNWDIYSLSTKVGVLRVTIINYKYPQSCNNKSAVLTVFSKFDSPDLAKTLTDCNSWSGKWNFHVFAKNWTSGKAFAEYVLNRIKEIL
jgi:hypothetical protein